VVDVRDLPRPDGVDVALSTSSTYPVGIAVAFETAARLGYDGIEVMVWTDPLSQDAESLATLSQHYGVPVVAIHAPTLLITQRVWGKEAWAKITGAVELAQRLGADTVVAHPPFRWQRDYAEGFVAGVRRISQESGVVVSVENMYPWRVRQREIPAYLPDWDPTDEDYDHVTVDLSHAATAGSDPLEMVQRLGPRLRHLHLADGSGSAKDEHLVPGRGVMPCAEVLHHLGASGWRGVVVLEVNTRRNRTAAGRDRDLAESLAFARTHLAAGAVAAGRP
jgi:sugar phosphate isomerase/epimerase